MKSIIENVKKKVEGSFHLNTLKPIIFIPGIQATSLVNTNTFDFQTVWNAYDTLGTALWTGITGPYIEEKLQINPLYDEGIETLIERNHIARLPYEQTLKKLKRDLDNPPIYLFGYDWRMSNVENGKRLLFFIKYLKEKLKDENLGGFRFLTHSMGGLVFSCFLKQLNNDYSDIDKAIITAPPFLGSLSSVVHMIKGDGGLKGILNWVLGRNEDMRKVIRTYPSLYELLPCYKDALIDKETEENIDLMEKNNWQPNIYRDIKELFIARLNDLKKFRNEELFNLSKLPDKLKDRMIIIVGDEEKTYTQVKVDGDSKLVDLNSLKWGEKYGDGTVPMISSTKYKASILNIGVKKEDFFDEMSNSFNFHGLFLRDSRVQNIIKRAFSTDSNKPKIKGPLQWWQSLGDTVYKVS